MRRAPKPVRARAVPVLLLALSSGGCQLRGSVVRVADGREIEGPVIAPESYATYMEGALAEAAGDRKAAERAYERAVEEDPDNAAAWARLGAVTCATDSKKAETALSRALDLDAEGYDPWLARAQCDLLHEQYRAALVSAKNAVTASPGDRDANGIYAIALSRSGSPEGARHWLSALDLFAPRVPTNGRSGDSVEAALDSDDAERAHRAAVSEYISLAELALRALDRGRLSIARSAADQAHAADPDDTDAFVAALVAADLERDETRFSELLESPPRSPTPLGARGKRFLNELVARRTNAGKGL